MKSYSYILSVLCMALSIVSCKTEEKKSLAEEETKSNKPNVILILVDDQGYGDIAALGNTIIKTPNIDALHASSARFTDYHVNPTCAPTRAALLTGHNANRAGVWHTVNGRSILLERETTVAQIMKDNGYATGIFGKWHLGDNYPARPQDKGFEEVLIHGGGGIEQTMDFWDNDYYADTYHNNGKLEKFEGFCTDIWFDEAMKFMETKKESNTPFFVYLPTNAAHTPYFVDDKYSAPYKNNENVPNADFYGLIANVDENIGKLVNYLETTNQIDNTILIFTTDNGTSAGAQIPKTDDRLDGFVTKGFNDGMRGIKASKYEGGHRVPLFIHWKNGGITVGKDIDALTAHYDVVPTLVDLCDLEIKDDIKFDGQSLRPLIEQGDDSRFKDRIVITNSQRIDVPEAWRRTSLMQGKWRLVDGTELYDLNTDPEQRTNIADKHPKKMDDFKTAYNLWWEDLLPGYSDLPRIHLGHEKENPVKIYCHDWHTEGVSPWHQRHIRSGYIDNGYWLVEVEEKGTYNFKLRRWPEETQLALNAPAPIRPALEGTSVRASKLGKVLNIEKARIKIQDIDETIAVDANQEYVEFTLDLEPGETNLQTWFTLDNKEELGAYYVSVEKI
ncbi:arylsulfatase [Formosa agariphila KMM 3901]|uniref:Arylsulfatase n=1 Tax=Formosa agariphila (strain DSM 15362 / KCTC 12365 / LMG 23005 / KMM 3901 / M-2Alg 35-1) TaxID=1347342 RepID=T2KJW1_FORAG|nr:arylsulfatase [Formosa agariphila]CDF78723.1 arylsulfatase [Formosa agariphila KMM 3901]